MPFVFFLIEFLIEFLANMIFPTTKHIEICDILLKYDGTYFLQCLNIASKFDMIYA
jgi:hypothetical protein